VLAGLLAIVGLVAIWLSDCIPGFGLGSEGVADGQVRGELAEPAEREPAEPEPAEPESERKLPMKLTIDARGCLVDGGQPQDCAALCDQDELFAGLDTVKIDAKNGPHETVSQVEACLRAKQLAVSITHK